MTPRFSAPYKYKKDLSGEVLTWASKGVWPRDPNTGARTAKTIYIYAKTVRDVHFKVAAWKPTKPTLDKSTTLAAFIEGRFLEHEERRTRVGLKPLGWATFDSRRSRLRNYLLRPVNDDVKVPAVSGRANGLLGVLNSKAVMAYCDRLLDAAVSWDIRYQLRIDLNLVFTLAEEFMAYTPRQLLKGFEMETKFEVDRTLFDLDEVFKAIYDEAIPVEFRLPVAFQMMSLARPSEMWALTWADFNDDFSKVRITKAMRRLESGLGVSPGTKNHTVRTTPIPAVLSAMLRAHRKACMGSVYVFETSEGLPMTKDRFKARWRKIKTSLGLTGKATPYSLKHLGNSWLDEKGVPDTVRAKLCGHRDTRMVQRVYRVVADREKVAATNHFDTLGTPLKPAGNGVRNGVSGG